MMNTILLMMGGGSEGGGGMNLLMIILMFGVLYFFMLRPQIKKQKELRKFREALKPGDDIVTIGGVHGKIKSMQETTVIIKIEDGTLIKIERSALVTDFDAHQQQQGGRK